MLPDTTPLWLNLSDGIPSRMHPVLRKLEERHQGIFIGSYARRLASGGWTEAPVCVFFVPFPDWSKGHGHYLGVHADRDGALWLSNAGSIQETTWPAAVGQDGEVVVSRFRHDFQQTQDKTASIDGGQDYARGSGPSAAVQIEGAALARLLWLTPPRPTPRPDGRILQMEHFSHAAMSTPWPGSAHARLRRQAWIQDLLDRLDVSQVHGS